MLSLLAGCVVALAFFACGAEGGRSRAGETLALHDRCFRRAKRRSCFAHSAKHSCQQGIEFARLAQPSWAQPAQLSLAGVISFNLVEGRGHARRHRPVVDRLALQSCP